jgi:hypothetical protein
MNAEQASGRAGGDRNLTAPTILDIEATPSLGGSMSRAVRTFLIVACVSVTACALGSYGPLSEDAGSNGGTGSDAGLSPDSGLPCDIAALLTSHCLACHGTPPANGAPMSLDSLTALRAPAHSDPSRSNAELSVVRMSSVSNPMPPAPAAAVPSLGRDLFSTWVSAGTPAGSCEAPDGGGAVPDAGVSDAGVAGDLPCDVAGVLSGHCTSCHGSPPSGGAPMSLNSRSALLAPAPTQPGKSSGQLAVERMASTAAPMPPLPAAAVPASEQSVVAQWVQAGMPAGSCGTDGGVDPVFGGPPTCTSGTYYQGGEGSTMHPGLACIACHSRGEEEAPRFAIAGTIYPTGHEYDDCNAPAAAGAVVEVTDNAGVTRRITANSVGNFSSSGGSGWPQFPIRARVLFEGRVRAMSGAVPTGDCNTCHTLQGDQGAPGRIALP